MRNFKMKGIGNTIYYIAVTSFTKFLLNCGCFKDLKGIVCLIGVIRVTGHSSKSALPAAPGINQFLTL